MALRRLFEGEGRQVVYADPDRSWLGFFAACCFPRAGIAPVGERVGRAHPYRRYLHDAALTRHPHVAQFLGLHSPAPALGFLYVGKPITSLPRGQRHPMADKVTWVED